MNTTHIERKGTVVRRNGKHVARVSFKPRANGAHRIQIKFIDGPLAGTTREKTVSGIVNSGNTSLNPKKIISSVC